MPARGAPPRVLLAGMPWAALDRPPLGLGLLHAALSGRGVPCRTHHLQFRLADMIGTRDYVWVGSELPYAAFAGDWLFTEALYGRRAEEDAGYVEEVLRGRWSLSRDDVARLYALRTLCEPYLERCLQTVPWGEADVVGFTSTFEQNVASLAMARRVKEAFPHVTIAFGGANWEGEMGEELHRRFPFVDLVCSGESDRSFPAALAALGDDDALAKVRGIVFRDRAGATRATGATPLVLDLDALPIPDFRPFFRDRSAAQAVRDLPATLVVETARGCWWGAKSHCTFCGLNGNGMAFRAKGGARALEEIRTLRVRHGIDRFAVADNILSMEHFRTLLPLLACEPPGLELFYEVKANLSAEQVALLAAAGVSHVQPGIESLSDHVLKLMRKGTTMLQNVQLLKWCREHDVTPEWNVLFGFPGEEPRDYEEMLGVLGAIRFLQPPSGWGEVRLDRFSPYHADPAAAGMRDVVPMLPYRFLYPFEHDALMRIAYYFDYAHADGRQPLDYATPVIDAIRSWIAEGPRGGLWLRRSGDRVVISDERVPDTPRTLRLGGWRARAYEACDRVRSFTGLARDLGDVVVPGELRAFLDACVDARVMLRTGERYLALAVTTPARAWVAEPPALVEAA
jgi:ribosomal peptide maturation radical SAM protein 1